LGVKMFSKEILGSLKERSSLGDEDLKPFASVQGTILFYLTAQVTKKKEFTPNFIRVFIVDQNRYRL